MRLLLLLTANSGAPVVMVSGAHSGGGGGGRERVGRSGLPVRESSCAQLCASEKETAGAAMGCLALRRDAGEGEQ